MPVGWGLVLQIRRKRRGKGGVPSALQNADNAENGLELVKTLGELAASLGTAKALLGRSVSQQLVSIQYHIISC